jgi:predicted permease
MASMGVVIGMISVYSLGSYMPGLISFITNLHDPSNPAIFTVIAFLFPFAYGFMASASVYSSTMITTYGFSIILASVAGSSIYTIAAVMAYRSTGKSRRAITLGGISSSSPTLLREVKVETHSPLMGMIRKDIKLATRNIGSAFIFAIPIFLIIIIFPMLQNWKDAAGLLRSMSALAAVEYANLFGGISFVSILMFDSQGASIHEGLPVSSRLVLKAKTGIMFVPYILSMLALSFVIMINSPITPLVVLIPLFQIPMGYVVGMIVGGAVFKIRGGGRAVAVNVTSDQAMGFFSAAIGALVGIVPLLGYGIVMLYMGSQVFSLISQGLIVIIMVLIARILVPRLLKD